MKKLIMIIFALVFSVNVYAEELKVAAQGAALMDAETGRVLWERNMDAPMSVESKNKIMTAIIALESVKLD